MMYLSYISFKKASIRAFIERLHYNQKKIYNQVRNLINILGILFIVYENNKGNDRKDATNL